MKAEELTVEVKAEGFDELQEQANDLADTLGDAAEMLADKVVVRNNRDCVINVYLKSDNLQHRGKKSMI